MGALRDAAFLSILVTLIALAGLVPWAFAATARRRDRGGWLEAGIVLALTVGAFALRWGLPFHTLIHENHHGYTYVTSLTVLDARVDLFGVPSSFLVLFHLANRVLPVSDENLFLLNALASAAGVGAMYVLARAVFGSRLAAWTSATVLLLLPVAIGFAPTEEPAVLATGFFLWGAALAWRGARDRRFLLFVTGALLVAVAASVRDLFLLLALTLPLLLATGDRGAWRERWPTWLAWLALPALLLVPRALLLASLAARCANVPCGLVGTSMLFGEGRWIEWAPPLVPAWVTLAAGVALVWLGLRALRTRAWRVFGAVAGMLLVARVLGDLVNGGWFPSQFRYRYLELSLLALPVGWLADRGLGGGVSRGGARAWLAFAAAPLAGVVTLALAPEGARLDLPVVQEYRFFRDALGGLEERARFVSFDVAGQTIAPVTEGWLATVRPAWEVVKSDAWVRGERGDPGLPTYLLLDRTCFTRAHCQIGDDECGRAVATPRGRMSERCARVLESSRWEVVAEAPVRPTALAHLSALGGQPLDLPGFDAEVRIAILRAK
jgi:hypothetical protein